MLLGNMDLARRFFHLVALTLAKRLVDRALADALANREKDRTIEAVASPPISSSMSMSASSGSMDSAVALPVKEVSRKYQAILQKLKITDDVIVSEYSCTLKKKKVSAAAAAAQPNCWWLTTQCMPPDDA
jgi:hypothetical protein